MKHIQKKLSPMLALAFLFSSFAGHAQNYSPSENYANPWQDETERARNNPCADPWVSIAIKRIYGPNPSKAYCAIALYNGGQWKDYNELIHAVAATKKTFDEQSVALGIGKFKATDQSMKPVSVIYQYGKMVAAGGGNMVAAGGGNLIQDGGVYLIGNDAGSVQTGLPTANFHPGRTLLSNKSIRLPKGQLVIK